MSFPSRAHSAFVRGSLIVLLLSGPLLVFVYSLRTHPAFGWFDLGSVLAGIAWGVAVGLLDRWLSR